MKYLSGKLKTAFYLPFAILFLMFGFMSFQNVHAQSLTMNHESGSPNGGLNNCTGPCANTPITLKGGQQIPEGTQDDEPEPPPQIPYADVQFYQLPEPKKPYNAYAFGADIFRPPDLIKLYANFRL